MEKQLIRFRNGDELKVEIDVLSSIVSRLDTPEGAKNWQWFTDSNTGKHRLLLNLSEVMYIGNIGKLG